MDEVQRAEAALQRHEQAEAQLYCSDGTPKYSEDEMLDRQREEASRYQGEVDAIAGALERQIGAAQDEIMRLGHADPSDALTTTELERANAKRAFVADDTQALPLDKLAERCRAALTGDDRVSMFLLSHFAGQRVGAVPDPVSDEAGSAELREVVGQLQRKLDPERFSKLNRARSEVAQAEIRATEVALRRGGHRSALESWEIAERAKWARNPV
jgi:hypothetical protein